MRYFRHTLQHNVIAANSDESIGHAIIPSEGRFNSLQGEVHCQTVNPIDNNSVVMYGCDGWHIPMPDPDTPDLVDDIWDRFVEKDFTFASDAVDLDTASADTINFDEPGVPNIDRIAGVENLLRDKQIYRRRKMISFQSAPRGFTDGTPEVYRPGDVFKVNSRKSQVADVMGLVIMGFGVPVFDEVTTTHKTTPTETQWIQIKYMEVILEQAWMDLVGLTEAGAETPYEEATALIADMLEPTVIEDTAAIFLNTSWDVFANLTWDLSVPGRRDFSKALTGAS